MSSRSDSDQTRRPRRKQTPNLSKEPRKSDEEGWASRKGRGLSKKFLNRTTKKLSRTQTRLQVLAREVVAVVVLVLFFLGGEVKSGGTRTIERAERGPKIVEY